MPYPWVSALRQAALPLFLGLLLRLFFIHHNPDLSGDPLLYGEIARNLLQHGVYGFTADAPTLIRLPGYPLFLAACFRVFGLSDGVGHFYPVLYLQVVIDLAGCWLLSRLAGSLAYVAASRANAVEAGARNLALFPPAAVAGERAATATLWLAALCPFTACYTAAPLTETIELFSITFALFAFARAVGFDAVPPRSQPASAAADSQKGAILSEASAGSAAERSAFLVPKASPAFRPRWFALATLAWTAAALLRPDGALLGVTLLAALLVSGYRRGQLRRALTLAAAAALASLLAFAPWTARNWRTFHVFEPLAPRYATDPGEPTNPGFQRWTKTICADLVCTSEVYWAADDQPIGIDELPKRAFDSPRQLRTTAQLLADYNRNTTMTPALDARFAALADERIAAHPIRYYLGMPLLRLADMWFRPRVELFNIDLRWWNYEAEGPDTILAWAYGVLNVLYLALALLGCDRWASGRRPPMLGIFALFTLLRCALLWTIEAPEPRYTLECFPMIFVLGGIAVARWRGTSRKLTSGRPVRPRVPSAS